MSWFDVDKEGLAKILDQKGRFSLIFELIQNAWDTRAGRVDVILGKVPGRPLAELMVTDDDPDGFTDLAHAFTLFAESEKKGDPTLRGRFNLGEKLVLALCKKAEIRSTKGVVVFDEDGTRSRRREKQKAGSQFWALIRMNQAQFDEACDAVHDLIPPEGVTTTFNDVELLRREPVTSFEVTLPTLRTDEEGNLKPTARKTRVDVYEPRPSEKACIYEMGIPVVTTYDRYHVDVMQKVPVTLDRTNVPPSYLRKIRAEVLNRVADQLIMTEASETWVTDALGHKDVEPPAIKAVLDERFGKKRAVYDPSDKEANNRLTSRGYTIIQGGTFGGDAWKNIKGAGAAVPAGKIAPTPKPYSGDPNADEVDVVPHEKWTEAMFRVEKLVHRLGDELLNAHVEVTVVNTPAGFSACYRHSKSGGVGLLDFNLFRLGHRFFNRWHEELGRTLDLIVHEFAHHYEENHLSEGYYRALTKLAGKLAVLALEKPQIFEE